MRDGTKEQYYRWYNRFLNGEITEKEWVEYCHYVLDLLLEENKDVLIRLKELELETLLEYNKLPPTINNQSDRYGDSITAYWKTMWNE